MFDGCTGFQLAENPGRNVFPQCYFFQALGYTGEFGACTDALREISRAEHARTLWWKNISGQVATNAPTSTAPPTMDAPLGSTPAPSAASASTLTETPTTDAPTPGVPAGQPVCCGPRQNFAPLLPLRHGEQHSCGCGQQHHHHHHTTTTTSNGANPGCGSEPSAY